MENHKENQVEKEIAERYIGKINKNGVNSMFVVCNDHLDIAIEEFVDTYEQPPDIYELDKITFTDWTSPHTCEFCDRMPKYLVV